MINNEILNIFKVESEEQLHKLEKSLLLLEKNTNHKESLDEAFRSAHTLKGSARMLGFTDIEAVAHHFEDILGDARREKMTLDAKVIDLLYNTLDSIAELIKCATEGSRSSINVIEIIDQLSIKPEPKMIGGHDETADIPEIPWKINLGNQEVSEESGKIAKKESGKIAKKESVKGSRKTKVAKTKKVPATRKSKKTKALPAKIEKTLPSKTIISKSRHTTEIISIHNEVTPKEIVADVVSEVQKKDIINTIHVESHKLDLMITNIGELAITKNRIEKRAEDILNLIDHYENLYQVMYKNRLFLKELEKSASLEQIKANTSIHDELENIEKINLLLKNIQGKIFEDNTKLDLVTSKLEEEIRKVRLLPLSTIFDMYPRMLRDIAKSQQKKVDLIIEGENTTADKHILEKIKSPLMHILRNAVDHGIETPQDRLRKGKKESAIIRIKSYQTVTAVVIEVYDDGQGIDIQAVKNKAIKNGLFTKEELAVMSHDEIQSIIFSPGFSTATTVSELSGRGMGMNIVQTTIDELKGSIQVYSEHEKGTSFKIHLPITITTNRVLIVSLYEHLYAIPIEYVFTSHIVNEKDFFHLEGCNTIYFENMSISVIHLAELLQLKVPIIKNAPCVILKMGEEYMGMLVTELTNVQEVVIKQHSGFLKRVRNVSGATILESGEICIVLNPVDMLKTMRQNNLRKRMFSSSTSSTTTSKEIQKNVLLVDDSILVRIQLKRTLEENGYNVITAADGLDAFDKLKSHSVHAVVTDVEMPNMNGLALTQKIRQELNRRDLPIILVTSLNTTEDRKKGLDVGANAYLTKDSFEQHQLLDSLKDLII